MSMYFVKIGSFKEKATDIWEGYKNRQQSRDYYFSPHVIIPSHLLGGISMVWLVIAGNLSDYYPIYDLYPKLADVSELFMFVFFVSGTFLVVEYGRDWCIKWTEEVHNKNDSDLSISIFYFSIYILFVSYSEYTDSRIGILIGVSVILLIAFKKLYQFSDGILLLRFADFLNWIVAILFFLLVSISILVEATIYDYIIFYIFSTSIILGSMSYYSEKLENPISSILEIISEFSVNIFSILKELFDFISDKL